MPFAIEMFFDAGSEKLVRDIWAMLHEKNITSGMPASGSRPHITLSILESLDISEFGEQLEMFVDTLRPLDLTFTGIGSFPGVLYLAPNVTEELLGVHSDFCSVFAPHRGAMWKQYRPGSWVPHCTLATDLPDEHLSRAKACVLADFAPAAARVGEIGLVEFPPVKHLAGYSIPG